MTRDVITVGPQFPLAAAWQLMCAHRIRHLPILQGGRVVGILSDRDLLLRASLGTADEPVLSRDPVAVAMTPKPFTCASDTTVSELASLMIERRIDAVPVLGVGGKLVGLVTSSDLLALLIDDDPDQALPFRFRVFDIELREESGASASEAPR